MSSSGSKLPDDVVIPHELIDKRPIKWTRDDVKTFLEYNKERYQLEDDYITALYKEKISGIVFCALTTEELCEELKWPYTPAATIEVLANSLKKLQRKFFPTISSSQYTICLVLITTLSSLSLYRKCEWGETQKKMSSKT